MNSEKSIELISAFEDLLTLKTTIDLIDLNYLSYDDLEAIILYANELGIHIDEDLLYNSNYNGLEVYNIWFDDINNMYLKVKNQITEMLNKVI